MTVPRGAGGRTTPLALRYPVVDLTLLVGAIAALLWALNLVDGARWVCSIFVIAVAVYEALLMVRQLRKGIFGIDILAIVAIIATVLVGEVIASMIIVLMVSGGKALEDFAQGRAQRELTSLLEREPQIAHVVESGTHRIVDVAASDVRIGDVVMVRASEVVPVDAELLSASASFDESSLTGESMPVTRVAGDPVLSGSVNGNSSANLVATALAEDSQFQAIVALVRQAAGNRAPVVRLADRFAIPFTLLSLVIGAIAWAVSTDSMRFAEVLVLATPCPLVLAAPVAFMGGMSRAARLGIIVKGGGVLEMISRTKTAVFDKTGTLTEGRPAITRVETVGARDPDEILALVGSAEQLSSHVLAASIVHEVERRGLLVVEATNSTEIAARGVTAEVNGQTVDVGTLGFIQDRAPDVRESSLSGGELAIYVAIDREFAGAIIATDPVRSNARATIAALRGLGIGHVTMLTGDAKLTADHVASQLDIDTVEANCLPGDKLTFVAALANRPVLMIGDGVNDSPALAAADVGIAMGARGASAASESAGAVILEDDISLVAEAVLIGHDTVKIALQSIWLGIGLSVGLMLVAAFGVIPATLGAGIQEVVDVATILNALRAIHAKEHTSFAR
ncbi:heavy metal translocating P-type ATPase [Glaciihabitans sp. UYNi722]|uniref:heavy metal translocating P-type ATPase n=1 Tax=Glaciihabitans sp. UYNi722 TaxID=3156344 RepID=UPI003394CF3E